MKVLTVCGLDDRVYSALPQLAKANHRSLQEQVEVIFEREIQLLQDSHVQRLRQYENVLPSAPWATP